MFIIQASFSSLPNETLNRIAECLAHRRPWVGGNQLVSFRGPYKDLCSMRLVSRRCNAAAAPQLFQRVQLDRAATPDSGPSSQDLPESEPSIEVFASLVLTRPAALRSVEVIDVHFSYDESIKPDESASQTALLLAFGCMPFLRCAFFDPYSCANSVLEALHPDVRLEDIGSLAPLDEFLNLDGPQFERLNSVRLNFDGHAKKLGSYRVYLYLPVSLSRLEMYSSGTTDVNVRVGLEFAPIPKLQSIEIDGDELEADMFSTFFDAQGIHVSTLVLTCNDLYREFGQRLDMLQELYTVEYHAELSNAIDRILPIIDLCPNLTTLTLFDIHIPNLMVAKHPTLATVHIRVEPTAALLNPGDVNVSFDRLSTAIQHFFDRDRFPQLEAIQYETVAWADILRGQSWVSEFRAEGLDQALDRADVGFWDGPGKHWEDGFCWSLVDDEE